MSNISVVTKNTGDQHTAAELNEQVNFINTPAKSLGAFLPSAVTLDSQGFYDGYTVSANVSITFSGTPKHGIWQKTRMTGFNGSYTLTVPTGTVIVNNSFTNGTAITTGTYDLWFAYLNNEYLVNLAEVSIVAVIPQLNAPTIQAASSINNDGFTINWLDTNTSPNEASFLIEYDTVNTFDSGNYATTTAVQDATSKAVTGLGASTLWYYRVTAVGDGTTGTDSDPSATGSETTASATKAVLSSATIENATDSVLDLVFDLAVNITTAGWNIDTDGAALSISSVLSGSGTTTPKFQLSRSVLLTETLNLDYDTSTGNTTTVSSGLEIDNITDRAIDNKVYPDWVNTHSMDIDNSGFITAADTALARSDGVTDDPFTMEAFVKFPTLGANEHITLLKPSVPTGAILQKGAGEVAQLTLFTSSGNSINKVHQTTVLSNTWYHIVATYDGSKGPAGILLYLDQVQSNTTGSEVGSYTGLPDQTSDCLYYIGNVISECLISYSRLYDKVLNQSEIDSLVDGSGLPQAVPSALLGNLMCEYRLNNTPNYTVGNVNGVETPTVTYVTDVPT